MRELIILRHAKAEASGKTGDFGRNLTTQGKEDAVSVGRFMLEQGWIPDYVVTSPALRARQTCDAACMAMGFEASNIESNEQVYEATLGTLLAFVGTIPKGVKRALIVGHNPGLGELALHLTGDAELKHHGLAKAGIVWCKLPEDWSELPRGCSPQHRVVAATSTAFP